MIELLVLVVCAVVMVLVAVVPLYYLMGLGALGFLLVFVILACAVVGGLFVFLLTHDGSD